MILNMTPKCLGQIVSFYNKNTRHYIKTLGQKEATFWVLTKKKKKFCSIRPFFFLFSTYPICFLKD